MNRSTGNPSTNKNSKQYEGIVALSQENNYHGKNNPQSLLFSYNTPSPSSTFHNGKKGEIISFTNHILATNHQSTNYGNITHMQNGYIETKKYVSGLEVASFPSNTTHYLNNDNLKKEDFERTNQSISIENNHQFLSDDLTPINSSSSDISNGGTNQSSKKKKESDSEYSENSALREEEEDELDFSVGSVGSMPSVPSVGSINAMVEEMKDTTTNISMKNEKNFGKSIVTNPAHIVIAQEEIKLGTGYNDFNVAKDDEIEDAEIDALFIEDDVKDVKESNSSTHNQTINEDQAQNKGDHNVKYSKASTRLETTTNYEPNISQSETNTLGSNRNDCPMNVKSSPKVPLSVKSSKSLIETDKVGSNSNGSTMIMATLKQDITITQQPPKVLSSIASSNPQSMITPKELSPKESTPIKLSTQNLKKSPVKVSNDDKNNAKNNHESKKRRNNWNSNSFVSLISNSTSIQNEGQNGVKKRKKKKKNRLSINVDSFLGLESTTPLTQEYQSSIVRNSSNMPLSSSPSILNTFLSPNQVKTSKISSKEPLSDEELEKIMNDSSNDDTRLIQGADRQTVTDFVWLLMKQVTLTHADVSDYKRSQRVKSMQVGYSGFTCRHCLKNHNDGYSPSRMSGRFFSSAPDNITAAVTSAFLGHLQKCVNVPKEIIVALSKVKKAHASQISSLPVGSQRRFIHLFWQRLRSYDKVVTNKNEDMNDIKEKESMKGMINKKEDSVRDKKENKKNGKTEAVPLVISSTPLAHSSTVLKPNLPIKFLIPSAAPTSAPLFNFASFYKNDGITLKIITEAKAAPPRGIVSVFAPWLDSIHTHQITDYVFLVMRQATICHVERQDFHRGKRSKTLEIGLGGLCCKDCKEGRSFPTSPDNIVTGMNVTFYNHILKCHFVSTEYKHAVTAAKHAHPTQMSLLSYGSQRKFVQAVFKALRENDADKVNINSSTVNSAVNKKTIHTGLNNSLVGTGQFSMYNNFPMMQGKSMNFLKTTPPQSTMSANLNKNNFSPMLQTASFIPSPPPNHQAPIKIPLTSNLKKNASSTPISAHIKDATSFVSSITSKNPTPLINSATKNLIVSKNASSVDLLDVQVPASDIILQRYAFILLPSKWWVCKYCRMVPLDFRSKGSLYSYKPTEKEIREHRFICHEDNLNMKLVIEALNGMMSTIKDISADILVQPLFKYIVLELVGGNKSLCELFTTEIFKQVDRKNGEIGRRKFLNVKMKTGGMWSCFPKTVNQDAVFHALDAFKKANSGICIKTIINNKHFRQYISCITPFWFDTIIWEKICDRLKQVDMASDDNENTVLV